MIFMTNSTSQLNQLPPPIRTRAGGGIDFGSPKPLSIGNVSIGFPVVQAALSGYSDGPMRIIARRLGASYSLAEVMIDRFVLDQKSRHRTRRHLFVSDEEHPVGGQLMGSNPSDFGPAAQRLVDVGFDVIDINFGCPVKSAGGKCRGGYLLTQPDLALEIVSRTRETVPDHIPVTLKMRRGLDDSAESRDCFYRILDGAFERGVSAITVHGRTVEQKYIGPSNWDFLREVKQHSGSRTILGSGDLFSAQACLDMLRETGVDGVSVARGAIGNPWIFQQARALAAGQPIRKPDLNEQRSVIQTQFELCLEASDLARALTTMRTFGIKFANLHPHQSEVRNAVARLQGIDDWTRILDTWY